MTVNNTDFETYGMSYSGRVSGTFSHLSKYVIVGTLTEDDNILPVTAVIDGERTVFINDSLVLNGGNSTGNGGIYNYTWTVDGVNYYGSLITLVFDAAGMYDVTLSVTDQYGLKGLATIEIEVKEREMKDVPRDEKENEFPLWLIFLLILSGLMVAAIVFHVIRNRDEQGIEE